MKQYKNREELVKAYGDKLVTVNKTCGISAQMMFGKNATVVYIEEFGWAIF